MHKGNPELRVSRCLQCVTLKLSTLGLCGDLALVAPAPPIRNDAATHGNPPVCAIEWFGDVCRVDTHLCNPKFHGLWTANPATTPDRCPLADLQQQAKKAGAAGSTLHPFFEPRIHECWSQEIACVVPSASVAVQREPVTQPAAIPTPTRERWLDISRGVKRVWGR